LERIDKDIEIAEEYLAGCITYLLRQHKGTADRDRVSSDLKLNRGIEKYERELKQILALSDDSLAILIANTIDITKDIKHLKDVYTQLEKFGTKHIEISKQSIQAKRAAGLLDNISKILNSERKMEITQKKISEIRPYVNNARIHSVEQIEQIMESIKEFGFTNPLIIDDEDRLIAGHGRLEAAIKLGINEVPCVVLDWLTEEQKKALTIADNKIALNAGWNEELLELEIEELKLEGFNVGIIDLGLKMETFTPNIEPTIRKDTVSTITCPYCGHSFIISEEIE
jgi:hypothetical protein